MVIDTNMSKIQSTTGFPVTNGATGQTPGSVGAPGILRYPPPKFLGSSATAPGRAGPVLVDLCDKNWFFVLLTGVTCLAMFNLGLTIWIMKVLQLGNTGLGYGNMHLIKKGINIKGETEFTGSLKTELIQGTSTGQPLIIESLADKNLVFKTKAPDFSEISISMGDGKMEIQAQKFVVKSNKGDKESEKDSVLFKVGPKEITTNSANSFVSTSLGGYKILSSFETNSIQGSLLQDLRLESRTKSVGIVALEDITTNSKAGPILVEAFNEIIIKANDKIIFDSKKLEMKGLPKANLHRYRQRAYETGSKTDDVFQVNEGATFDGDQKKRDFKDYLEEKGVLDILTNVLASLFESDGELHPDPIEYVKNQLNLGNEKPGHEQCQKKIERLEKLANELKEELENKDVVIEGLRRKNGQIATEKMVEQTELNSFGKHGRHLSENRSFLAMSRKQPSNE